MAILHHKGGRVRPPQEQVGTYYGVTAGAAGTAGVAGAAIRLPSIGPMPRPGRVVAPLAVVPLIIKLPSRRGEPAGRDDAAAPLPA